MARTVTLRLDDNTYATLKRAAAGDRRTISNFIEYASINYILNNNTVDDNEMNEILTFEKNLKRGLRDIKTGRYKIID
jgi:predicted transcriptional regulator